MHTEDEQQISFLLNQVLAFYGKELDEASQILWMRILRKYNAEMVKRALAEYPEQGRFAPKPSDIAALVDGYRQEQLRLNGPPKRPRPEGAHQNTGPVLEQPYVGYWRYVIDQWGKTAEDMYATHLSEEEVEAAIAYVNKVAAKESIPPHLHR